MAYRVPGNRRRTIDIAFPSVRVAVFVDGCFWHGCPEHGTRPKSNASWWAIKLAANLARDEDTTALLEGQDWLVVRVWEHEPPGNAAQRVETAVRARKAHG